MAVGNVHKIGEDWKYSSEDMIADNTTFNCCKYAALSAETKAQSRRLNDVNASRPMLLGRFWPRTIYL